MKIKLIPKYKKLFQNKPKKRYTLVTGGRGSAKSFHVSLLLLNLTYQSGHIILFTRWTLTSSHISIIPEFLEKIELLNKEADFDITKNEITNRLTGSKILFRGIKTSQGTATANLKSISGVTTWVLDEAEELHDKDIFDRIDLSIRSLKHINRVILVMNPTSKLHWIYQDWILNQREDTEYIHTTYEDNLENLSESFIKQAKHTKEINYPRYAHLFLGDWIDGIEGILWNRNIINQSKTKLKPNNLKTIVAIDPATTSNKTSDETGIVVCGALDGKYYVIDDLSGKYTPNEWAIVAHNAFKKYNCDMYVAEKNQGGDMVKSVLRQVDQRNHIKLVQATKGKYLRAEPIYSLYEQGKVFHVNDLPILENQMISFNPETNTQSPDRVDALVWGLTELSTQASGDYYIY